MIDNGAEAAQSTNHQSIGVGLSDYSATGNNPNSLSYHYGPGTGVPTYLKYELSSALAYGAEPGEIHALISWTRNFSLRIHGTDSEPNWSWGGGGYRIPGIRHIAGIRRRIRFIAGSAGYRRFRYEKFLKTPDFL